MKQLLSYGALFWWRTLMQLGMSHITIHILRIWRPSNAGGCCLVKVRENRLVSDKVWNLWEIGRRLDVWLTGIKKASMVTGFYLRKESRFGVWLLLLLWSFRRSSTFLEKALKIGWYTYLHALACVSCIGCFFCTALSLAWFRRGIRPREGRWRTGEWGCWGWALVVD